MISNISNIIKMFEESEKKKVDEIVRLENENRILKLKLARFEAVEYISCDQRGCMKNKKIFALSAYCHECKPEDYEEIK